MMKIKKYIYIEIGYRQPCFMMHILTLNVSSLIFVNAVNKKRTKKKKKNLASVSILLTTCV